MNNVIMWFPQIQTISSNDVDDRICLYRVANDVVVWLLPSSVLFVLSD